MFWNKKRGPVEPIEVDWGAKFDGGLKEHRCGNCRCHLEYHYNFCPECGTEIKWKRM